jgi:hypothetical protein
MDRTSRLYEQYRRERDASLDQRDRAVARLRQQRGHDEERLKRISKFQTLASVADSLRTVWTPDAVRMAEDLLVRIEARETIHRRELAALAHAALELPHVLLARDVLHQKGPLAVTRAIALAELILGSAAENKSDRGRGHEIG